MKPAQSISLGREMQDDYISTEHLLLGLAIVGKARDFQAISKEFRP